MAHQPKVVSTLCRLCAATCGMTLTLDGDRVVEARGDPTHPLSRGYACPKGRAIPELHHSSRRLTSARVRGTPAGMHAALDDVADALLQVKAAYGRDVIGSYLGTGGYFDSLGRFANARFMSALGSPQVYSASTIDGAPMFRAAELVTGFAERNLIPRWDPTGGDGPGLLIVLGWNPVVSHGWIGSSPFPDPIRRLREFRATGGRVVVVDPRRTAVADLADSHLALRPGTDALLLGWLVRELLEEGADAGELRDACRAEDIARLRAATRPFTLDQVSRATGLEPADMLELLDAVRRSGTIAAIAGTGFVFGPQGLVAEWLRWVLLIITGSVDRGGPMYCPTGTQRRLEAATWRDPAPVAGSVTPGPRSRPELSGFMGQMPCAAMVDEIEAGELRALVVFGGNILTAFPDPVRTRAVLSQLDVLVVIDSFESELGDMATHVLPSTWMLERADLMFSSPLLYAPRAMAASGEQAPAWWLYVQLAKRMGLDLFAGLDPDGCSEDDVLRLVCADARWTFEEIVASGMRGLSDPRLDGWVHDHVLPDGRWRLAPEVLVDRLASVLGDSGADLRLISGRQLRAMNSMAYAAGALTATDDRPICISRDDAERCGIGDGDRVRVASPSGSLEGTAVVDDRLSAGAIWINHGSFSTNVSHLTDIGAIDPLTSQPFMSALDVTLSRPTRSDG